MTKQKYIVSETEKGPISASDQAEVKRAYESGRRVTGRTIATLVLLAVGIFLLLHIVAKVALYDSIPEMLVEMGEALSEVFKRIVA